MNMNKAYQTLEMLQMLSGYYLETRGVGHTQAMLRGADQVDNVRIMTNIKLSIERHNPSTKGKCIALTPEDIRQQLSGIDPTPLVWDNSAISVLLGQCVSTIDALYDEVGRLNNVMSKIRDVVDEYGL